jgi:hypothetical protein
MNNLLNEQLLARFKELGPQDVRDPVIVAKFFAPWTFWIWYAFAYDEEHGIFFGLIKGQQNELGYFSLGDLRGVRGSNGLKVERDLYWREKRLSELVKREPQLERYL